MKGWKSCLYVSNPVEWNERYISFQFVFDASTFLFTKYENDKMDIL